jgi:membrane protease YdiL (CAAX protease family)
MTINKSKTRTKQLYTLTRVILFYICSVIVLIFTSSLMKNLSVKVADLFSILLATIVTFLLIVLFTRWEKLTFDQIGLIPRKKSVQRFIAGYTIGLSMAVLQALIVLSFGHFQLVLVQPITVAEIVLSLLLYLLIACREELVFRSYSLRSLNYSLSSGLALFIITAIFILEHIAAGMTWKMAIIGSGLGGILFGLSALKTKGLALPLGLHSAWNFGQWSMGFKGKPGIWEGVIEKGYESSAANIGLAAFVLVMVLAIIGVLVVYRKESMKQDNIGAYEIAA